MTKKPKSIQNMKKSRKKGPAPHLVQIIYVNVGCHDKMVIPINIHVHTLGIYVYILGLCSCRQYHHYCEKYLIHSSPLGDLKNLRP